MGRRDGSSADLPPLRRHRLQLQLLVLRCPQRGRPEGRFDVLALGGFAGVGSAGGPGKGALISTTRGNTSGRASAHQPATGDPKS
jgi:hypothetical protein